MKIYISLQKKTAISPHHNPASYLRYDFAAIVYHKKTWSETEEEVPI